MCCFDERPLLIRRRQSNIDLVTVARAFNATAELAACPSFPNVRLARVTNNKVLSGPLVDLETAFLQPWAPPSNATCSDFSATCYFAARDLFLELGSKVPVGVVQSAIGGTVRHLF